MAPSAPGRTELRALPGGRAGAQRDPPSDDEILQGLREAEPWASEALYDACHGAVERTLLRILRCRDAELDDLVQTTFERVFDTLMRRRFAGACSLTAWASAIATHVALDELRTRTRDRRRLDREGDGALDEAPAHAALDRQLEARSELARLQALLGRMRPDQAQALLLHDALGYELPEMAVLLDVSIAAAQSRLVRARKELLRRARSLGKERTG